MEFYEKHEYFDHPCMVIFKDDEDSTQAGIAYHDEIICACCGGVFETSEAHDIKVVDWVDLTDVI